MVALVRAQFLVINIKVKINKKVTIFAIAKARYDLMFKILRRIGGKIMHIEILVKEVREQKGMTMAGLARKSGVSAAHLSDIEKDFKSPSLLVMVRLAKALNVEITDLYRVRW